MTRLRCGGGTQQAFRDPLRGDPSVGRGHLFLSARRTHRSLHAAPKANRPPSSVCPISTATGVIDMPFRQIGVGAALLGHWLARHSTSPPSECASCLSLCGRVRVGFTTRPGAKVIYGVLHLGDSVIGPNVSEIALVSHFSAFGRNPRLDGNETFRASPKSGGCGSPNSRKGSRPSRSYP